MRVLALGLLLLACDGTLTSDRGADAGDPADGAGEPRRSDAAARDAAAPDAVASDARASDAAASDVGARAADARARAQDGATDGARADAADPDARAADATPDAARGPDAGALGLCPGPEAVRLAPEDWTAPQQGHAERRIRLAAGPGQYRRMVAEFDVHTTTVHGSWTQLVELKVAAPPRGLQITHRYGAYTFQNNVDGDTGMNTGWRSKAVLTVWDECMAYTQNKPDFQVQPDSDYHVRFVVDAEEGTSRVVLTGEGGLRVVAHGVAAASMVPALGRELVLVFGIRTDHGDFRRGMRPPWGWTVSNLSVELLPGGPFGPGAPDCEGNARAACP